MAKMKPNTSGPKGGDFGLKKGAKIAGGSCPPAPIPSMNPSGKVKPK